MGAVDSYNWLQSMSYLVKQAEIDKYGKSALTAGLLSMFLGPLGIHRFYLKRYMSGRIMLITTLITFGMAVLLWIPWTFVEGIILIIQYLMNSEPRQKKPILVPAPTTISHPQSAKQPAIALLAATPRPHPQIISDFAPVKAPHQPIPHKEEVAIYDISATTPSAIKRPVRTLVQSRTSGADWISRLELPYERRNLRIPELRKIVYATYEQLAQFIDRQLNHHGSSLNELVSNIPRNEYSYYDNLLYTIFCIAEGHVEYHYSNGGYNNSFSYELLQKRTSVEFIKSVKQYAAELVKGLPPASDTIKHLYGLTPNGLAHVWWDADGYLREHFTINRDEERVLRLTPPRSTKLYETPEVRWHIFRYYFAALEELYKQRRHTSGWKVRIGDYLDDIFDNDKEYVSNNYSFTILNQILKLAEQALREKLPYARTLSTDSEIAQIRKSIPRQAADAVQAVLAALEKPKLSDAAIRALMLQNPSAWKHDIPDVKTVADVIILLKRYSADESMDKIAKELIKSPLETKVKLVAIYALSVSGKLDAWGQKKLDGLIDTRQAASYAQLVKAQLPLSIATADKLEILTKPPRKHVILDEGRMQKARADHNQAVKHVEDYLGEAESDIVEPKVQPTISMSTIFTQPQNQSIDLSDDQKEFMRLVIADENGLDTNTATTLAKTQGKMLNGYLQSLNKLLYELVEDQVIVQRDGRIVIEPEYRKTVKELI